MYIATGQGQTTPGDKILMSSETSCHFGHLLQVSKKSLWSLILYIFFIHDFIHVYSPRAGADNPLGTKFDVSRNILSLRSFVASLKKISNEVWFYTFFFVILYMYIVPGQGQTPPGDRVLMSTEMSCHFIHLLQVSKNVFEIWFYTKKKKKKKNHDLIHVHSPGAGTDSLQGTKFWCQQKGLTTLPICCKFQRNLFEVWFYTIFSGFNTCI